MIISEILISLIERLLFSILAVILPLGIAIKEDNRRGILDSIIAACIIFLVCCVDYVENMYTSSIAGICLTLLMTIVFVFAVRTKETRMIWLTAIMLVCAIGYTVSEFVWAPAYTDVHDSPQCNQNCVHETEVSDVEDNHEKGQTDSQIVEDKDGNKYVITYDENGDAVVTPIN